jgi:transposase-like protein
MLGSMSAAQAARTTRTVERSTPRRPAIPRHLKPIHDQGGPGTAYKHEFARVALGAAILGATIRDLAELFDVSEQTIFNWRREHPAFAKAFREGSRFADANVANAFFRRCVGLTVTATTTVIRETRDAEGQLLRSVHFARPHEP